MYKNNLKKDCQKLKIDCHLILAVDFYIVTQKKTGEKFRNTENSLEIQIKVLSLQIQT